MDFLMEDFLTSQYFSNMSDEEIEEYNSLSIIAEDYGADLYGDEELGDLKDIIRDLAKEYEELKDIVKTF